LKPFWARRGQLEVRDDKIFRWTDKIRGTDRNRKDLFCGSFLRTSRWNSRVSSLKFEGHVTKFAPHEALESMTSGRLTLDEKVVLHRVECEVLAYIWRNQNLNGLKDLKAGPFSKGSKVLLRIFCAEWRDKGLAWACSQPDGL
jgi:hypothetical protein